MAMPLADYLELAYPLRLIPDPDGGYVFEYPDLPGCLGQIDSLEDLAEHAEEARSLWIETAYERGRPIPLPAMQESYSGRFVVRIAKTLHQRLVETAAAEGVSLNSYVGTLLALGQREREQTGQLPVVYSRVEATLSQR